MVKFVVEFWWKMFLTIFPSKRSSKISFQTSPEVRHQFRRKLRQLHSGTRWCLRTGVVWGKRAAQVCCCSGLHGTLWERVLDQLGPSWAKVLFVPLFQFLGSKDTVVCALVPVSVPSFRFVVGSTNIRQNHPWKPPFLRSRPCKPNQRKADPRAGFREFGVFSWIRSVFPGKRRRIHKDPAKFANCTDFLWILRVFPGKTRRIHACQTPQIHKNRLADRPFFGLVCRDDPRLLLQPPRRISGSPIFRTCGSHDVAQADLVWESWKHKRQAKTLWVSRESPRQTKPKKGPKRKIHELRPFLCEFWCFFLGKTSTIHIELLFRNAPGKSSWTGLSLVWFAGVTPEWGYSNGEGVRESALKLGGSNATPLVSRYSCRATLVSHFFALCFRSVARESRYTP